jgi:hypothetical protein
MPEAYITLISEDGFIIMNIDGMPVFIVYVRTVRALINKYEFTLVILNFTVGARYPGVINNNCIMLLPADSNCWVRFVDTDFFFTGNDIHNAFVFLFRLFSLSNDSLVALLPDDFIYVEFPAFAPDSCPVKKSGLFLKKHREALDS